MIALNEFSIKKVKVSENETTFQVGPLMKGYGHTLGNILRRILLSSVPGAAITSVKLNGAQHEYSSLEGVSDDVLRILLSIKNVVVSSSSEEPVELSLSVKGKKGAVTEVKAGDFEKNSSVEIINKDYVITTLTDANNFDAVISVSNGIGYSLPNQEDRKELGKLPIDANYSPVTLVHYEVVPTRVGQETELDQLNLTITTNGAVAPMEALNTAANILSISSEHLFAKAKDLLEGKELKPISLVKLEVDEEDAVVSQKQPFPVMDLNLSTRLTNALLRSNYDDLNDLESMTEEELANIKGMGKKSLDELLDILQKNNIKVL